MTNVNLFPVKAMHLCFRSFQHVLQYWCKKGRVNLFLFLFFLLFFLIYLLLLENRQWIGWEAISSALHIIKYIYNLFLVY